MPFYGAPELDIEYTFVAVSPFQAEHPIGSGQIVQYQPGDEFPGADWGNAAHNLVEVGKAVRLAINVGGSSEMVPAGPPAISETEKTVEEVNLEQEESQVTSYYPIQGNAGWWTLSDGSKVRGEDEAMMAQAELDSEA